MSDNSIFLIDLDDTLYNAVDPWKSITSKIIVNEMKWRKFPWNTYFAIKENYQAFEFFFQKSFRHFWLSEELVTLLFGIKDKVISSDNLLNDLLKFNNRLSLLKAKENRPSEIIKDTLKFIITCKELNKAIHFIKDKRNDPLINEIEKRFREKASISCYDGVINLLNQLLQANANFYLVSEGDYNLQIWKTKLLSIYPFFKNRIITTEIYKKSPEYLMNLNFIKKIASQKNNNKVYGDSTEIITSDNTIRKYELLKMKDDLFFYYAVLNSIRINQKNPTKAFLESNIDELLDIDNLSNEKVIIIGDRVDKDLIPIWKIKGKNSELIRMRSGKYKVNKHPKDLIDFNYREFNDFRSVYLFILRML